MVGKIKPAQGLKSHIVVKIRRDDNVYKKDFRAHVVIGGLLQAFSPDYRKVHSLHVNLTLRAFILI